MEILFDLDGTLTDSGPGITRCIQDALRRLGRAVPEADSLRRFVGPPLQGTFALLLESTEEAEVAEAIRLYRKRFVVTGMFENAVYPGVHEGLDRLRGGGHRLWVATSKPAVYARRILEHFGIAASFAGVYGPDLAGGHHNKRDLIRELLSRERLAPRAAFMVGDRALDIEGARANGVSAVAVTWGFGTTEEIDAASPDFTATTFAELCAYFEKGRTDEVYIIGAFGRVKDGEDSGKFVLALRRGDDDRWLIAADMDNSNRRPSAPPTAATPAATPRPR